MANTGSGAGMSCLLGNSCETHVPHAPVGGKHCNIIEVESPCLSPVSRPSPTLHASFILTPMDRELFTSKLSMSTSLWSARSFAQSASIATQQTYLTGQSSVRARVDAERSIYKCRISRQASSGSAGFRSKTHRDCMEKVELEETEKKPRYSDSAGLRMAERAGIRREGDELRRLRQERQTLRHTKQRQEASFCSYTNRGTKLGTSSAASTRGTFGTSYRPCLTPQDHTGYSRTPRKEKEKAKEKKDKVKEKEEKRRSASRSESVRSAPSSCTATTAALRRSTTPQGKNYAPMMQSMAPRPCLMSDRTSSTPVQYSGVPIGFVTMPSF